MRVAYVVPRYGPDIVGGAELAARMLAERLAAADGWQIEVFTTGAVDSRTWADEYPEGTAELNGVAVHRFHSTRGRDPRFDEFSSRVLARPGEASPALEEQWIDLQGPQTPALLDAVAESPADVVAFYPYLYWPTVHGIRRFCDRAVLHPATHNEAPIRLPLFRDVFGAARGLVFHTESERRLTERLFPNVKGHRQALVGLGVEPGPGSPELGRAAMGIGDRPFLLCLGRVDAGKGTRLLAEWFMAYKQRRPGRLALVFAGPVVDRPPAHPDICLAGMIDEEAKWGALRAADLLVSPSPYESFSLVLLEGWLAGRPALVNAVCEVTRDHCRRSGGGVWFSGYASFESALDRIVGNPTLQASMGWAGRRYVEQFYAWPRIIDHYRRFLALVSG